MLSAESQCSRARNVLESRVRQGVAKGETARYLVQDVLQFALPIAARYKHLDVIRILQDNCHSETGAGLEALIHALSILERYGKNLLRSDRPPQWRVVRLSNSIFKKEVDVIKGSRDILKLLGYMKTVDDGLAYHEDCLVPDTVMVASVTADILLLRQELTLLVKKKHHQENDFFSYIPHDEIRQLQGLYAEKYEPPPEPSPSNVITDITNHRDSYSKPHPHVQPPSYEAVLRGAGLLPAEYLKENATEPLFHPTGNSTNAMQAELNRTSFKELTPVANIESQMIDEDELCDICGTNMRTINCRRCDKVFCPGCDKIWHNNPKRRDHPREPIQLASSSNQHMNEAHSSSSSSILGSYDTQTITPAAGFSKIDNTQEQGHSGNHSHQPTISGARLPQTATSRSPSLTDNEWNRKVNRMASELTDINDPLAKERRLLSFLSDLDGEGEKYKKGILQLRAKGHEKPSLTAHFEEKIKMIEDLKVQLKNLVGYIDPVEIMEGQGPQRPQVSNHHDYNHNSVKDNEETWSFKSATSHNGIHGPLATTSRYLSTEGSPYHSQRMNEEYGRPLDLHRSSRSLVDPKDRLENPGPRDYHPSISPAIFMPRDLNHSEQDNRNRIQRLEDPSAPVAVANLIDFSNNTLIDLSTENSANESVGSFSFANNDHELREDLRFLSMPASAENRVISPEDGMDEVTQAKTTVGVAGGDPLASKDATSFKTAVSPSFVNSTNISSAEDLVYQSALDTPMSGPVPESPTQNVLKRLLPESTNGQEQPTKLSRGNANMSGAVSKQHSGFPEISKEFENMNIEPSSGSLEGSASVLSSTNSYMTSNISYAFDEPISRLEIPETSGVAPSFRSINSPNLENVPIYAPNRLEESHFHLGEGLMHSSSFMQALTPEELQKSIKKEEDRLQTTQFIDWIRAGDVESFKPNQVQVAVTELEKEGNLARVTPNAWIERKWFSQVSSFIEYAKTQSINLSPIDAEKYLLESDNNFEEALRIIQSEQNKLMINLSGEYGTEKAREAMGLYGGDEYLAGCYLQQSQVNGVFEEFVNMEGDDDVELDDMTHLKRTFEIENNERISHSHLASFEVAKKIVTDTFNALLAMMPDDMKTQTMPDVIEAASNFPGDVDAAMRYLNNECMICMEKFPQSKITNLPTCGDNECKYCLKCLEEHLSVCITDKNLRDIVCPVCSLPNYKLEDESIRTHFFNHIDVILRRMENKKIHEIFQQKLRDFTLMRMPTFRWCSHCSAGFQFEIEREQNLKMVCPFCNKATCFKCKKQWQSQHDGITCEQFQLWKENNDPEFQAAGLARHLKENGIDCPDCKFRYALAKGGCMHFKCTQCSHEFCSGCYRPFKQGRACNVLRTCHSKGLHAHHPRDCLFFLRDNDPRMLQDLLRSNRVAFDTEGKRNTTCPVMEQKETSTGMKDDNCGRKVNPNNAGLCRLHYNEYLVNLVNTHQVDPADTYTIDQLKTCLMREDKQIPDKRSRERDNDYKQRLLIEVKKLPLMKSETENGENEMEM